MKKPTVAICYDFDGTLSPKNMQEFGFFHGLEEKERKSFWAQSNGMAKELGADQNLMYMRLMIEKAEHGGNDLQATEKAFRAYGSSITYFKGVETWFKRIKEFAIKHNVIVNHYIISSGLKELVLGSTIGKYFKRVYACSFMYDKHGVAKWPCQVVNCTTKTQYLFRINKGVEDESDTSKLNAYSDPKDRPVPFTRIIYIGDGSTDVPCMRLVKEQGGTSIAVYKPRTQGKKEYAEGLFRDNRVNYIAPADYSDGSDLDMIVKRTVERVAIEWELEKLGRKLNPERISTAKKISEKISGNAKREQELKGPLEEKNSESEIARHVSESIVNESSEEN